MTPGGPQRRAGPLLVAGCGPGWQQAVWLRSVLLTLRFDESCSRAGATEVPLDGVYVYVLCVCARALQPFVASGSTCDTIRLGPLTELQTRFDG